MNFTLSNLLNNSFGVFSSDSVPKDKRNLFTGERCHATSRDLNNTKVDDSVETAEIANSFSDDKMWKEEMRKSETLKNQDQVAQQLQAKSVK